MYRNKAKAIFLKFFRSLFNRVALGFTLAIIAFLSLERISGGGLWGSESQVPKLSIAVFLKCENYPTDLAKRNFTSKLSLRSESGIIATISAFGQELDRAKRRSLVYSCESMTIRTNFKPENIILPGPREEESNSIIENCRINEYCFNLPPEEYAKYRGQVLIQTGQYPIKESMSTRAVQIAVSAGQPSVDSQLELDLPNNYVPESVIPPPNHMISLGWIKMYWEGSDKFGRTAPKGSNRGRLEDIGVNLRYSDPKLKRIESSLIFLFSALFGVGFTIVIESLIRTASNNSNDQVNKDVSR